MRGFSIAVCLVAVLASSAAVQAGPITVFFETNPATLVGDITAGAGTASLTVTDDGVNNSRLDMVLLQDGLPVSSYITIGNDANFDIEADLTLTQNGTNDWSASGTLRVTDVDKTTYAIDAAFQSLSVSLVSSNLEIVGGLSGSPILVNRDSGGPGTWTFEGDFGDTVSVSNVDAYTVGSLFVFQFATGASDLDELFGSDRSLQAGQIKATVVPAPTALLLAGIGVAMSSRLRRRGRKSA